MSLVEAINGSNSAEVIKRTDLQGQVRIVHRVFKGRLATWLGIVEYILRRKPSSCAVTASKQYFLHENKLAYVWNFIISSQNMAEDEQKISELIYHADVKAPSELISSQLSGYPLVSRSEDRNKPGYAVPNPHNPGIYTGGKKHKGAYYFGGNR